MSVTRIAASLAAALLLGAVVAVTASSIIDLQRSTAIGFWGWVNGSVVGLAAFGALLAASPGNLGVRRAGAVLLSVVLAWPLWPFPGSLSLTPSHRGRWRAFGCGQPRSV